MTVNAAPFEVYLKFQYDGNDPDHLFGDGIGLLLDDAIRRLGARIADGTEVKITLISQAINENERASTEAKSTALRSFSTNTERAAPMPKSFNTHDLRRLEKKLQADGEEARQAADDHQNKFYELNAEADLKLSQARMLGYLLAEFNAS